MGLNICTRRLGHTINQSAKIMVISYEIVYREEVIHEHEAQPQQAFQYPAMPSP